MIIEIVVFALAILPLIIGFAYIDILYMFKECNGMSFEKYLSCKRRIQNTLKYKIFHFFRLI